MIRNFCNRINKLEEDTIYLRKRSEDAEIVCKRLTLACDLLLKAIETNVLALHVLNEKMIEIEQRIKDGAYIQ